MPHHGDMSQGSASAAVSRPDLVLEGEVLASLLPHRYPFLMVDRIRVIEPGRRAIGSKRVTGGEWWCATRDAAATTREAMTMPYSLVVEALAQTTCALLQESIDGASGAIAYFAAADRVRLRRGARPGDLLQLAVTLVSWRRGICRTRGVATVDGALVASATLTTMLRATA
jgi:3-hydroxymyristoyl/3-hydroxydecanoyl-(acyl carrier protein) dehydratase